MHYDLTHGDLMQWAAEYTGPRFHAMLCDPPYGLEFMGAAWDSFSEPKGGPRTPNTWGDFGSKEHPRTAADQPRVQRNKSMAFYEFSRAWLEAIMPHLHPGAFCMAFSSTRTVHRLMGAAEDVGYILHPFMGWSFGSGFPKATRVKDAAAFTGHRYGGQAIKPAFEPIVVFQKPYAGRPVESITRTGAGALWIDGGRVASGRGGDRDGESSAERRYHNRGAVGFAPLPGVRGGSPDGRWPANLLLSHNPDCNGHCSPGCAVAALGAQSGESIGPNPHIRSAGSDTKHLYGSGMGEGRDGLLKMNIPDTGTAARFFFNADYFFDRIDSPVRYIAKASTAEREAGLDGWQPTTVDDGRAKSIDNPYQRGETERRNTHPTVKPIDLCRYLATLLLPPDLYAPRRLLVPFAGSGSEMIGAGLAGWEQCHGIELEAEHVAIARARLAWWVDVFGGDE